MIEIKNKRMVFACWSFFWVTVLTGVLAFKVTPLDKLIEMYQWVAGSIVVGFLGTQTLTDHRKLSNGNGGIPHENN